MALETITDRKNSAAVQIDSNLKSRQVDEGVLWANARVLMGQCLRLVIAVEGTSFLKQNDLER